MTPVASSSLRPATLDDRSELESLIARSARGLASSAYTSQQIEAALGGAFGVDTQLIRDGTYFVAEVQGRIVACGGWSLRATLFGADGHTQRDARQLDPRTDAARIRAFFIDPGHARQGLGRAILQRCESEARARGFRRLELMAMLSGVDFYLAHGYHPGTTAHYEVTPGLSLEMLPMSKQI